MSWLTLTPWAAGASHLLLQTMPVLLRPTIASPLADHCAASVDALS